MSFEIKQGDALSVLKALDSESIQCVITSPPYYGLRSYGTDPIVWGNHNGCSHQWALEDIPSASNISAKTGLNRADHPKYRDTLDNMTVKAHQRGFCLSCNAWRGELGLEPTFQLYISHLIEIFAEVKRVLKKDGTCFVNLGDSYASIAGGYDSNGSRGTSAIISAKTQAAVIARRPRRPPEGIREKSLMNIPARFAIAMTDELQMIQRNELVWHKPACMPSSATDRWTVDFEPIYFFAKSPKYKFNQQKELAQTPNTALTWDERKQNGEAMRQGLDGPCVAGVSSFGTPDEYRNARTVRKVNSEPQSDEHYASYPTKLVEPFTLAGTDEGDTVLDIFAGTGTTLLTALRHRRNALGIELQPKYIEIANRRLAEVQVNLF